MYVSLFFVSLLSATMIPMSSEAALVGALALGLDPFEVLFAASLGNCIGVTINYFLGLYGITYFIEKIFKFDDKKLHTYQDKYRKYNYLFLLASWLPIIGDPITLYLGIVKCNFVKFSLFVYTTRIIRYIVIIMAYQNMS